MDGSEPGETVPAAVLSGAPTDLQARTVRYESLRYFATRLLIQVVQDLSPIEAGIAIWKLAHPPLAHGLGYSAEGSPMGEPSHWLAVVRRLYAGYQYRLQDEGRCHYVRPEARIRVLRPGAK